MRYFPREKAILVLVVPSLILLALMLLVTTNTITNVSGVISEGVGVYWDSSCTVLCKNISWGTLTPGSASSKAVYIRNVDEEPVTLIMKTTNWNSWSAYYYINLEWTYTGQQIDHGETLQTTLTLSVSRSIKDVSYFSFDILITDSLLGDVNGDGTVTGIDVLLVTSSVNFMKPVPPADPRADVNNDSMVNGLDLLIVSRAL
jgi:hypothetical protein